MNCTAFNPCAFAIGQFSTFDGIGINGCDGNIICHAYGIFRASVCICTGTEGQIVANCHSAVFGSFCICRINTGLEVGIRFLTGFRFRIDIVLEGLIGFGTCSFFRSYFVLQVCIRCFTGCCFRIDIILKGLVCILAIGDFFEMHFFQTIHTSVQSGNF